MIWFRKVDVFTGEYKYKCTGQATDIVKNLELGQLLCGHIQLFFRPKMQKVCQSKYVRVINKKNCSDCTGSNVTFLKNSELFRTE